MGIEKFQQLLRVLDAHPPSFEQDEKRAETFLGIGRFLESSIRPGQVFDLVQNPNAVWQQVEPRLEHALAEIEHVETDGALMLWQMYNAGVIIKTGDVVLALDVIPMLRTYGWDEPPGLTKRVASLVDALLVTHWHGDHYDKKLIRECLNMGKPVLLPESLASDWEKNSDLHAVGDGWALDVADIHIKARRGFHVWRETVGDVPVSYYEITCQSGYTFMFGGDVDYTKAFEKTPGQAVDLLFLSWRSPNELYEEGHAEQIGTPVDAARIALERVRPQRVLYGHYAELEHVRDGFPASYDIALDLKRSLAVPSEWLFWGEKMALPRS